MLNRLSRTELLLGAQALRRLSEARVAVFGVGGVGGYAAEALARSGVGALDLVDDDRVCLTNLNRQILATRDTIGQYKVDAAEARIRAIDPGIRVVKHREFFLPETAGRFDFSAYDYVVDAVDTVKAKLGLAECCRAAGTPLISAMGAGNKLDASLLEVADIYETSVCPLARVMRKELKRRGIPRLKVVYSKEAPLVPREDGENSCRTDCVCPPGTKRTCARRRSVPGSVCWVPAAAGMILAGEVVRDLTEGLVRTERRGEDL